MNDPWLIGSVAFVVFFTIFEVRAFRHPERQNTLSRFVWIVGQNFPLSLVMWGMLIGGLSVHFYWHWCPAAGVGNG